MSRPTRRPSPDFKFVTSLSSAAIFISSSRLVLKSSERDAPPPRPPPPPPLPPTPTPTPNPLRTVGAGAAGAGAGGSSLVKTGRLQRSELPNLGIGGFLSGISSKMSSSSKNGGSSVHPAPQFSLADFPPPPPFFNKPSHPSPVSPILPPPPSPLFFRHSEKLELVVDGALEDLTGSTSSSLPKSASSPIKASLPSQSSHSPSPPCLVGL